MASTADNSAQKVVTEEQAGNRGLPVAMWAVTEVATTETDDGVHTTAETSQLRAAASASEDSVLINEDSEDLFSRRQRGIHRRKSFFQREAKTDTELRKILNIKRKGDIQEGAAVFIQRFARNAREDRFRVSAADCIRVSSEVGARRQGVHHLFKYLTYMMLFIAMLALQKDPSRALSVESALRDQFENVDQAVNENWLDVSNFEELGDWIVVAIDNLHIANMFQSWGETKLVSEKRGSKVATAQRGQISSFNNVISGLALIQTRGTVVDCEPQSSRTVGGYLPTYAPYCYTNTPTTESYGPPPTCKTAAEIARKTTGTRAGGDFFLHCLEDGVDVFDYTNATDYATPHAKKYKYSSVSQGYIEIIDLGSFGSSKDEANAQWAELVEDSWLDKQSREMMIVIMTYNANTGLYGIGTLSFQLNVGGVFKRKLAVESYVISNQYRHYWDFIRLAIEILFFGWTGISTLNEFKQMRHHGCADYWSSEGGIWNVIDWLATIALMCNLALWTTISVLTALWVMPGRSASLGDTAYESVESIFVEYSAVNQVYQYYGATNVISLLFMIIRLLKNLNYHPKLAIVSKTIGNAAEDLIHFSVVFVVVVCVYSFMGMVIAGRQMREFATFDRSVINLVLISMGEFGAWEELYLISPLVGSLFFFSYLAIVTVLMMNIILAIVVDSFEVAAVASEGATSVFHDMAVTFMVDIHLFCKLVSCTLPSKSAHLNSNSSASFALVVCMERICGKCCKRSGACAGKRRGKHCFALCCPHCLDELLPKALADLSEEEFRYVHLQPVKIIKQTLKQRGVPPWALSIVIEKVIRPRKNLLTWGNQAPDWWPKTDSKKTWSPTRFVAGRHQRRIAKHEAQKAREFNPEDNATRHSEMLTALMKQVHLMSQHNQRLAQKFDELKTVVMESANAKKKKKMKKTAAAKKKKEAPPTQAEPTPPPLPPRGAGMESPEGREASRSEFEHL